MCNWSVARAGAERFEFEVATFRAEGAYHDFRRPALEELRFGTLEEDYQRRDFTVNAMYYDPLAEELIDPANGRDDLELRLLRCVGDPDRRFHEDALRLHARGALRHALRPDGRAGHRGGARRHAPCWRTSASSASRKNCCTR